MSGVLGFVASYAVNALWETALIAASAWLAARLLRRVGPRAEHAVWVAALVLSVLTPALPGLYKVVERTMASPMADGVAATVFLAGQGGAMARTGALALPLFWTWLLASVYAAAFACFAVRLVLRMRAAGEMLRGARPAALTPEQDRIWRRCEQAFSLKGAQILACAGASGPAALGLRRPILLLPSDFASSCAPQDFLAAVAHECAHLKRRDFSKNLLYEAASLLLAFHPLVGVIKARIAQTREMICDGMVTEGQVGAGDYARSLLRLATMIAAGSEASASSAVGIFEGGVLKERVMRIRMGKQSAGAVLRYGLGISAAALLFSTVVGSAAMAVPVTPQAAAQDETQTGAYGHVYKVGNGVSAPVIVKSVLAHYPDAVLKDKKPINGKVFVGVVVDADGTPQDVHVVRSFRADFDAQAAKAAKQYRFKPAMRKGKPVAASITMEVNFDWYGSRGTDGR